MAAPTVSIIIPVYNRTKLVIESVKSVLTQQYTDFEIIVVDDGSTPPLRLPDTLCKDERIEIFRLEQNQGPSAARNAGAKMARGKWLAWLDSDDQWHPDKLAMQISYLKKLGQAAEHIALACGFEYRDDIGNCDRRVPLASSNLQHFFSGCWFCPGSTVILSRSLFVHVGPYDETLHRLEDYDWFNRMARIGGRLEVVPENLVTVATGQKASLEKVKASGDSIMAKYDKDLPSQLRRNLRAYLHLEYAASALKRDRKYLVGLSHIIASWMYRPRTRLHLFDFWQ